MEFNAEIVEKNSITMTILYYTVPANTSEYTAYVSKLLLNGSRYTH